MNKPAFLSLFLCFILSMASGQDKTQATKDTLSITLNRLSKNLQALERIKISGYIQTQYQSADTLGAKSFNGGDFAKSSAQRFMVRRAYLKFAYSGNLSTYVIQFNANEKGISLRDAYFSLKDPWLKSFFVTGGIFFRPFSQELLYPTSQRESPELSRMIQTLFPGERDLGTSIAYQPNDKSKIHPLRIEAGLFTGNGPAAETDDRLDFIGRLSWTDDLNKPGVGYGVGVSYYNGSVYQAKKQVYQIESHQDIPAFIQVVADTIIGDYQKREYLGMDLQFSIKTRLGNSSIRADYVFGIQPSADTTSFSPSEKIGAPLFLRKFNGNVVYFVHTFPNSMHSFVVKYDFYDPNSAVKGNDIGRSSTGTKATNSADLSYSTWGFGYFADINKNLRLTLYYDLVKNEESSNLSKFMNDQKDNIFTFRLQYKF